MRNSLRVLAAFLAILSTACGDDEASDETPDAGETPDAAEPQDDGGGSDAAAECDGTGKPELTGPITGLQPSYGAGDPIDIGVSVDEDTQRVIVGVYAEGSELYLGGTAEDVAASSTTQLSLFAGVVNGETGTFYLAIELCSTEICTLPFVRNTYQRADRTSDFESGETYEQTRENVGDTDLVEVCPTDIAIQSFEIE